MPQAKPIEPLPAEKHALVMENVGLAYSFARRFHVPHMPFDDVVQVCLMAMTRAARTYDQTKARFSTYACRAMQMDLVRLYLKAKKSKRGSQRMPLQFPNMPSGDPQTFAEKPDRTGEIDNLRSYLEGLIERLPEERLRFVLRQRFFEKHPFEHLAVQLGVTKEAVRQMQIKALGELRAMIEWEERTRRPDWLNEMKAGEIDWNAFLKLAG